MNVVGLILALVAGGSFLAGAIQGLVAWHSADPNMQKKLRPFIIGCTLLTIALIVASYYSTTFAQNSSNSPSPTPTSIVTSNSPSSTPTSIVTSSSPSPTPTSQPTSTPLPTLSGPQTLPENIRLNCHCSDRVVVTITKIAILPQQNKMLWSITFFNNSQRSADAAFADSNFYLQDGDQINDPAPGAQKYSASGSVIGTFSGISLQAGETQQVIVTFSFVPYTATPYTFVSTMQMDCCGNEIAPFIPVLFTF